MFRSTGVALLAVLALFAASPGRADPHPAGFEPARFNGSSAPVTEGNITTFHIGDRECSDIDYGDGRGETDCINGNVRSMLRGPDAQLGQSLEYKFDIMVDPALDYEGYFNPDAGGFEPKAWDSHLRLASWEGTFLHNFIYALKASTRTGITFVGETCQAPEDLGKWVSFSMKVKWDGDGKGWVSVTCDGRYVYNDEATSSNVAPDCYVQNQCVPGEVRNPRKLLFLAGVQMGGWGYSYKETGHDSPFVALPPAGITVKMRDLSVTPDPQLYDDAAKAGIAELQGALNALGCDVGTPDGLVGRRTREAALSCRDFPTGTLPRQLNVATAPAFLALYT